LPPRSGLERSDFVHWPAATLCAALGHVRSLGQTGSHSFCAVDHLRPDQPFSSGLLSKFLPAARPWRQAVSQGYRVKASKRSMGLFGPAEQRWRIFTDYPADGAGLCIGSKGA